MALFKKKQATPTDSGNIAENGKTTKTNVSRSRIPRNVLDSIPYRSIYPNGIIEDYDGRFSKTYRIKDANFDTEEESRQESLLLRMRNF